jgi:hypothetical protein
MVEFARFVRCKPGRIVHRHGTADLIGAELVPLTRDQRRAGSPAVLWTNRIVPLTADYCRQYSKELRSELREESLIECSCDDWESQEKTLEKQRVQRVKDAAVSANTSTEDNQ